MASTGKKGKKTKGKTVPLNDFLSNTTISWSDLPDEPHKLGDFTRKPALPAAPRAARALEINESKFPKIPPYVAYVSNLSYELQDSDILNAFVGLNVSNVRLPKDERNGRLKGFGYVEFGDRESFISALVKYEVTIRGRRIKIDVAENEGERRRGGSRDIRDRESNYESGKTSGDWRSGTKRSDFPDDGRSGRKEYSGFRERDSYDKGRGGESSWRDSERRFGGDRESRAYGSDRDTRGFGSHRNYNDSESFSEPKTRTKLNLKPRTKPIEDILVTEGAEKNQDRSEQDKEREKERSSASIFGQAKPVDTAAREREIEQRLEKEKEGKIEKEFDKSKPKNEEESFNNEIKRMGHPESKENIWVRKSLRQDPQNVTDYSGGKKPDDLQDPDDKDEKKKALEVSDESSSLRFISSRRNGENESDRDNDNRYSKSDIRYNDRNREGDRFYGRDDRWKDDKDRRDRDRDKRDHDRRDRGYDSDKRTGSGMARLKDRDRDRNGESRRYDRDSDSKRYSDREGDYKRYNENDWKESSDKDGDIKRGQDRENERYKDPEGNNKNLRAEKRGGPGSGDKVPRQMKFSQDRERGPQSKEKPRDQKKNEDNLKLPKLKEAATPNYIGTNKYSCLDDDEISE